MSYLRCTICNEYLFGVCVKMIDIGDDFEKTDDGYAHIDCVKGLMSV
jgi:hypothetical protein